jgi:hypothetical protein
MRHSLSATLILLTVLSLAAAQELKAPAPDNSVSTAPTTALEVASTVEVGSISEPFLSLPVVCSADHTIFVRMAGTEGISGLVSISNDGKNVIHFQSNKINDISNPKTRTFFVTESEVYILTTGSTPQEKSLQIKKPNGEIEQQGLNTIQQFVARFGRDGSYLGSVRLDLDFMPYQVGVFPGGDFLFAGATKNNQVRLALVKSNGQFQRYVELEGDIQLKKDSGESDVKGSSLALPMTGKRFGEGFQDSVQISFFTSDGTRLLLVRKAPNAPIFSISAGGDVRTVKPPVPSGYTLADLKAADNIWIGTFTHRISDEAGLAIETFALDPKTGEIIQSYSYPRFLGLGIACADGLEFSFLTREDDKLKIIRLLSADRSSSVKHLH